MRLTDKERWRCEGEVISPDQLVAMIRRDEWIRVARDNLPNGPLELLELGAAPGNYSVALSKDRAWVPAGIDYSDDADMYLRTMSAFGKKADLYRIDFLLESIDRKFDIVFSVGLIEHFRGKMFDDVLKVHDHYLRAGGYLVITLPNFTGVPYLWHYVFDRPDLTKHNIDAMRKDSFLYFEELGYETLYADYVGVMRLWGNTGYDSTWFGGKAAAGLGRGVSALARGLDKIGLRLSGPSFAPHLLYVARKPILK
jgi:SAM-dependent methyltransferase